MRESTKKQVQLYATDVPSLGWGAHLQQEVATTLSAALKCIRKCGCACRFPCRSTPDQRRN